MDQFIVEKSYSNRRKLDSPKLDRQKIKKQCRPNAVKYLLELNTEWSNKNDEIDSILSDINISQESRDFIQNNDNLIQCTQKFLDDLGPPPNNDELDYSKFFSESQYETSQNIHNKTLISNNESFLKCTQELLNDLDSTCAPAVNNDDLDYSKNFSEPQYEPSQDIHKKQREIDALSDITWQTQFFPEEEYDFPTKGSFFGLPNAVEHLIYEQKRIECLYEWQTECLNLPAIRTRKNLIYALPTSGGKTLVAEILMLREIICRRKNVLLVLPYVSIVQEKVSAMTPFALTLDFLVEEYTAGKGKCPPPVRNERKSIFISSIEKGALLLDSLIEANRANEIGLVVVDELHLIGEKGRGATLETLLTKIMFLKAGIQIVGMSATIGNLSDLSIFLESDIYTKGFRPVELKEYIKCGNDILSINPGGRAKETLFSFDRKVNFKYSASVLNADPDHLAGLVAEVIPNESCLIFCSTRKNCENVAVLLTKVLLKKKHLEIKQKQRHDLIDAIEKICGSITPKLAETIPFGVAYHHSGLITDERKLLETAYRFGTICVICCTSTLAAGVNLPAKRVIIRAPYVGNQFMTLCQYKQMVGRAGRAGMGDTGESFLICSTKDNYQVGQMLYSPMDKVQSALTNFEAIGLQTLILSSIGLKLVDNLGDLERIVSKTLLAVQSETLEINVRKLVTDILKNMFKHKVLHVVDTKKSLKNFSHSIITSQELDANCNLGQSISNISKKLVLSRSTNFKLSIIGRASFKAGIDYSRTEMIYDELINAQKGLVLTNCSHLLYLVISLNSSIDNNFINIDPAILFREYNNIDNGTREMVKMIGITEGNAVKMFKTMSLKGSVELKFIRLYKVFLLNDVINLMPLHLVANKYNFERGMIQNLISQSVAAISSIVRLCDEIDVFWCYKALFEKVGEKLDRCCTVELMPLLELPAVKINRAKQFFGAGFKTIEEIAKANPKQLSESVEHLRLRTAKEIISAAKMILIKKLESLEEETQAIKNCLNSS